MRERDSIELCAGMHVNIESTSFLFLDLTFKKNLNLLYSFVVVALQFIASTSLFKTVQ